MARLPGILLAALCAGMLVACGGGGAGSANSDLSGGSSSGGTPTPAPTPAPTLSLSASPTNVSSGGSSTLTWSSTNATSCAASGAWSGSKPTSGTQSTGALTSDKTYTLKCDGTGSSITKSVTVSVYTNSNSAALSWDANSEPDVAGYRVYYGTSPGNYVQAKGAGIVVNGTSYVISGLTGPVRYYFSVTAYDSSGNESDYAREASKDIP